jgi:hypothetical protein
MCIRDRKKGEGELRLAMTRGEERKTGRRRRRKIREQMVQKQ